MYVPRILPGPPRVPGHAVAGRFAHGSPKHSQTGIRIQNRNGTDLETEAGSLAGDSAMKAYFLHLVNQVIPQQAATRR